jgi:tetratricopeptide (TPR) repeat protein
MRQRRRFWILGTLGLLILHPLLGAAEARSEATETAAMRLQRGFEALDEGDWDSAAVLFGGLSREHTTEAEIFYYLGVAEASRGDDYAAALAFANAAALDHELDWVHADLGISLFRLGEFELAEDHLLEALLQGPDDADVLLHLGLIDLENGNNERGQRLLEESAALDPGVAALAFYQAANYELDRDRVENAMLLLEKAILAAGPEDWRVASTQLLAALAESEAQTQRLRLSAGVGFEYDDNLTVSEQDLSTGIGDNAVTMEAGLEVDLLGRDTYGISAGYDFYQSLYQDLTNFDLQSHEPHAEIYGVFGGFRPILGYTYRNQNYGGKDYLSGHLLELDTTLCGWRNSCALLAVGFERLHYNPTPERDAYRYGLVLGQQTLFVRGLVAFTLSWEPEWQDAVSSDFDYSAQIVRAGLSFSLNALRQGSWLGLSYEFESRDYEDLIRSIGTNRQDDQHLFWAGLRIPLLGPTQISFDYMRIGSRSNIPTLTYDENIVSFKLWAWR